MTEDLAIFQEKATGGTKIHAIVRGDRWKDGKLIEGPRGTLPVKYDQANTALISVRKAVSVQTIKFRHYNYASSEYQLVGAERVKFEMIIARIDGRKYPPIFINTLAVNEGFTDVLEFHRWFWPLKNFEGFIIHFTDFRYGQQASLLN